LQQAVFNEGSTVEETSLNTDTPSPNGIIYSHNRASQDQNLQEIKTAPQYSLSSSFSVQLSTSNLEIRTLIVMLYTFLTILAVVSSLELTSENYDELTAGKSVLLKHLAPW